MRNVGFLLVIPLLFVARLAAQSPSATINGLVLDPTGAAIGGAEVVVVNDATGVQYVTKTNGEGIYVVSSLPPGSYRIQVSSSGFKTIIKPDIVIHVQDALAINFTLPVGATSEAITVKGGTPLLNTESAAVSTVVDHTFIENTPLNGRSFQDLILLTPGVVTSSPQQLGATLGFRGEFSVNGQRTESNNYSVDGVSADVGVAPGATTAASISGSLPAATALGTTQGLVSIDALQEFRVQSSTYSAEYGRHPGGQFSFVTRAGTNSWHGTAFDYLRNDIFDANDWFNDFLGKAEPPLRQNDFGGTLAGPVDVPRLYRGRDKTFFFFSYEGLRLMQPQEASITFVPNMALRTSAASALQPVLNAFPVPTPNTPDPGNGLAEFVGTWSNPSQIDSTSIRVDHAVNTWLKLFFRFSNTSSTANTRSTVSASLVDSASFTTRTYTLGATSVFSTRASNELRLNYSSNDATDVQHLDNFGGAQAADLVQLQGINPKTSPASAVVVGLNFPGYFSALGPGTNTSLQRQWNFVDTVLFSVNRHQLKFGVDWRRLAPLVREDSPNLSYEYDSQSSVMANSVDSGFGLAFAPAYPVYINSSAFAQDDWRATSRLSVSAGLRWEVNPPPGATDGNLPYTVQGSSLSTLALAPQGTPLWHTTWYNFAPRLGVAHVLRNSIGYETVLRSGAGVFFDTGQQAGSFGFHGPGFTASNFFGIQNGSQVSFPASLAQVVPIVVNPPVAPYGSSFAFPTHLQLPYTLQWNVSAAQALGRSQAVTISYLGAHGARLIEQSFRSLFGINPNFSSVTFFQNGLTSDYGALQVQFQRRLSWGLTALASYTWAHAIDYGSQNTAFPYVRGNSDYDIRHSFSGAFSFDIPNVSGNKFTSGLMHGWGLDDRFSARTGFPITLNGRIFIDPATQQFQHAGLNLVPGQPIYVYGSQYPGGRAINSAAFSFPTVGELGDAPRNFLRGFGAWQMDLALRRQFPVHERLKLQFRAEAFNIFNHPNFGMINANFGNILFGRATATLAQSLGILSPLYQQGGPRSVQFALKASF